MRINEKNRVLNVFKSRKSVDKKQTLTRIKYSIGLSAL